MNLIRFGRRLLKFPFWEPREKAYPFMPGPYPRLSPGESRQGALAIFNFPTGAVVNGTALPPGGDRGKLTINLHWLDAPPGWFSELNIVAYMVGDPIDVDFVANPTNSAAGRGNIQAALGDTAADIALKLSSAIGLIFSQEPLSVRWEIERGRRPFNDPATKLIFISPRTAQVSSVDFADGAWAGISVTQLFAQVVPHLYAGLRPGPQVVRGDAFNGFSPPTTEE